MADSADESDSDHVDFETALSDVERVVHELESGQLGLSESLSKYEQGIGKIKRCQELLEKAEHRVSVLTQVDEDGTPHVVPVDSDVEATESQQEDSEAGPRKRSKRRKVSKKTPKQHGDGSGGLF
ncbi:MAG: exodeoxyribonuclease VII small subunit [Planctomycetota bacterium]